MTAVREFRVDRGQLRKPVMTDEGFLQVEGYVARPGIYEYLNTPADEANGLGRAGTVRRELKPREEVLSPKTLEQYAGATLTAEHPPGWRVTPENAKRAFVGTVKAGRADGDRAAVTMVIQDADTIARVKRGELNELSPGIAAMIHRTPGADRSYAYPGNPEGAYDCVQRDIDVNHLALTDFARGGKDLRIRVDSAGAELAELDGWKPPTREVKVEATALMLDDLAPSGPWSGAKLRAECATMSDAAAEARCDSLMAMRPHFEEEKLVRDLSDVGDRLSKQAAFRHQALRADSKVPSPLEPRVVWPPGFDRAKTISTLRAAGLPRPHLGARFLTLDDADDYWLLGALDQLLSSRFASSRIATTMGQLGYKLVISDEFGSRWVHAASREASAPTLEPTSAARGDSTVTLSHRDRWREGLADGPINERWQAGLPGKR